MYRNRFWSYLVMGHELGSATDIDCLLCLQECLHHCSPWSGKTIFGAVIHICRPKMSPKIGNFEFSWIFRRVRVGFSKLFGPAYALLYHAQCFQFSSPNLQCLATFGGKKLYQFSSTGTASSSIFEKQNKNSYVIGKSLKNSFESVYMMRTYSSACSRKLFYGRQVYE